MDRQEIDQSVKRFLKRARRREKWHLVTFNFAGLLTGSMVPVVALASGGSLDNATMIGFLMLAWCAALLYRFLGRGKTRRVRDRLAEEFQALYPQDSAAYQAALAYLIESEPRKGLVDELIQRVPAARHLDAVTGGGKVSFAPVNAPEPKAGPAVKAKPAAGPKAPHAKNPAIQSTLELLNGSPFLSQADLESFLKDDPKAQSILTKFTETDGGFHMVKVVSSSSQSFKSGPAAQKPKPKPAHKPAPADAPTAAAPNPNRQDFIPLDPFEAE